MGKKIYVTGMHSGQNPCSGVGISRCIRKAHPDLTLVGVDHWQGSSGLHDTAIDEFLLLPQWKQLDDTRHTTRMRSLLDDGNLWISALDMEVHWLAENLGQHPHLLAPGGRAVELTAKPAVTALEGMDFRVPEFIPASLPDSEIHTFLRHSSWQCWLKSPYHDARRISSWGAFERSRDALSRNWRTSKLFLQRHVMGNEETIAFTAYQGELLGAVHLEKLQLTPEGKTWAGRVEPADPEFMERFREVIRRLEWSGGGEIEYVRDPDGHKWLIECNPRFPAWIYGAALSGMNLPGKLIARIWDLPLLESVSRYPCFTRVVQELPAKEAVGLPLPPDPSSIVWTPDGKKGKGGPSPAMLPRLNEALEDNDLDEGPGSSQVAETVPAQMLDEVGEIARGFEGETPVRIHLERWTSSRFTGLASRIQNCRSRTPEIRIGYSVKTSPTDDHLRKARERGFFAECISQMEVRRALGFGFKPHEVILNGPGKFWPLTQPPVMGLHMLFCDSVDEFDRVIATPGMAGVLGFRMRLPKLHSRFGNPLDDFGNFRRIVESVRKIGKSGASLGFHFHMPSWAIGVQRWMEALQSLLIWCQTMEQLGGVPIKHLDFGGGFFPADLETLDLRTIQDSVGTALPEARALYFEPGRSLTQDGETLVSRVLDVRKTPEGELIEVVVDACIAELPLAQAFSHRIFYRPRGGNQEGPGARLLNKGSTRILGRICMEDDILSNGVDLPETVEVGDLILFGDAGGYERTMSYVFGRG